MSIRDWKEIPLVPICIHISQYIYKIKIRLLKSYLKMHAFTGKGLLRETWSHPIELTLIRNCSLRTISVRARVFKSRRLPASGFRKKCSPFPSLPLSFSVSPSFPSKNLPGWRRARCLPEHAVGDLGENRTINGIPRGINDCGAAFPAKFWIEDRTADRIYRVVATWTLPREDFPTFLDKRE